jgi:hypothetical protein
MIPIPEEKLCGIITTGPMVVGIDGATLSMTKSRVERLCLDILTMNMSAATSSHKCTTQNRSTLLWLQIFVLGGIGDLTMNPKAMIEKLLPS